MIARRDEVMLAFAVSHFSPDNGGFVERISMLALHIGVDSLTKHTVDPAEMGDTMLRLRTRWRRQSPFAKLLAVLVHSTYFLD